MNATKLKYEDYTLAEGGVWFPRLGADRKRMRLLAQEQLSVRQESDLAAGSQAAGSQAAGSQEPTVNVMNLGTLGRSYGVEVRGDFHFAVPSGEFQRLREILSSPRQAHRPVVLTFDRRPGTHELCCLRVDGRTLSDKALVAEEQTSEQEVPVELGFPPVFHGQLSRQAG